MKKKKEAADEEAKLALEEYEQLENRSAAGSSDRDASSGRKVYGVPKKMVNETRKKEKLNNYYGDTDSESDVEAKEDDDTQDDQTEKSLREPEIDPSLLREEFGLGHESVFKVLYLFSFLFHSTCESFVHLFKKMLMENLSL